VLFVPLVLSIWLVKTSIKLSKGEILTLEAGGFRLLQRQVISLRQLFVGEAGIDLVHAYAIPNLANEHPKS